MVNIAFTGGGTGGHIYPGLAVAAELKKLLAARQAEEYRIFWVGSSIGMDRSLVEEAGLEFFGVPSGKLRRYFSIRTIIDFFKVIAGYFAARKILKKQKAILLFSKGGFVSVPPMSLILALDLRQKLMRVLLHVQAEKFLPLMKILLNFFLKKSANM
jgi:UDP-N-acetylglucosamine--N-acetylmuramyl-(pentapeptide) pyrophosphoryl-undecaprenol N-acetylglucosamine transferase